MLNGNKLTATVLDAGIAHVPILCTITDMFKSSTQCKNPRKGGNKQQCSNEHLSLWQLSIKWNHVKSDLFLQNSFLKKTADPVSAAEIIKQYKSKAIKTQSGLKAKSMKVGFQAALKASNVGEIPM